MSILSQIRDAIQEDGIDCFYDDEKIDAFIEKVIDRMEKHEDNEKNEKKD